MTFRGLCALGCIVASAIGSAASKDRAAAVVSASSRAENQASSVVSLSVRIVPRVAYGGTVYAIVAIRNALAKPLWVNSRLVVSTQGPDPVGVRSSNVWFDIRYRDGASVEVRCSAPSVPRHFKPQDYRLLAPGETLDSDVELSCFDLSRLGQYTLVAHYLDHQESSPPPPAIAVPLNYELVSAPAAFAVMGSTSKLGGE